MKTVVQHITLIGAIVVSILWLVGQPLWFSGWTDAHRQELYNGLTLGFVSVLAINELLRAFEKRKEQANIDEIAVAVRHLENAKLSNVEFSRPPSTVPEYVELWAGFTDRYYVYNPSYQVERKPGLDR